MKKTMIGAVICSFGLIACGEGEKKSMGSENFSALNTASDTVSYFIGADLAKNIKAGKLDEFYSEAALLKGVSDMMENGDSSLMLSMEEGMKVIQRISMESQKSQHTDKIKAGEDFLNEKSREEGVVTLPSGLRYKVIKEGTGEIPQLTDEVTTHYHGTLLDGTVFDSSVERGEPAKFPVNRVIPAWTEALQLMPVGSKWELYTPYNLAYGEMGTQGGPIGPYETLIFEVELLEINQPVAPNN